MLTASLGKFAGCVDSDGRAYTWGYGSYWQLGTGKTVDGGLPQQVLLLCSSCSHLAFVLYCFVQQYQGAAVYRCQILIQAVFQALPVGMPVQLAIIYIFLQ